MQEVHAYVRTTRNYRDGWGYLDSDRFVGTVKMTPLKITEVAGANSDYSEGPTYVRYARAPSGINLRDLAQGIRDTMGGSNCKHEHDCCGCATRHVSVSHLGSRRLVIRTRVTYNY
jgi:hypothetical protein